MTSSDGTPRSPPSVEPRAPGRARTARLARPLRVVIANAIERAFGYGPGAGEYLRAALLGAPELEGRIEVRLLHLEGVSTEESVERILAGSPDLVGMCTYSWNLGENGRIARGLRARGAACPIVWGGPSFALLRRDAGWFRDWGAVDAVAIGSGERTLTALARRLHEGGPLDASLAGLAVWDGERLQFGPPTDEPTELDELPSPYQLGVAYQVEHPTLEMARGCVFDCSYCSDARSSRAGGLREHGLARIAADIAAVASWPHARVIDAGASTGNVTDAFFARVCDAIRLGDPGGRLAYRFQLYPSLVSEAQREALAGISVAALHLGVQSLTRETFRPMRRGSRVELVERALGTFRGVGPLEMSLILGLPGETYESFVRTFEALLTYSEARLVVNRLLVLPGTPYHLQRGALGIELDEERYFRVRSTPSMSSQDLRRAQDYVVERAVGLPDLFEGDEARVRWVNFDAQARFGDPPEYQGRAPRRSGGGGAHRDGGSPPGARPEPAPRG
ncbi:MAG: cobalamin-dependent protein [Polyangiaceae bacterium]|nr:cobalamin-dependent protein [Polyangiaceae bacterium]